MAPSGENVVVSSQNLEKLLSMKGGKGEASYANNCQAQAQHARSMLHLLEETLDRVHLDSVVAGRAFAVADLGCSSGTNTIHNVEAIIKVHGQELATAWRNSSLPTATAPTLLPPYQVRFYRRLFPARSVDVFYSAFSLHWLSQVPDAVLDKRSTAYNKGRVFIHGANESTVSAYKKQFQIDLAAFLRSRSTEMRRGGTMFLTCLGRTCVDPTDQGGAGLLFGTHFQDAWDDLVQESLIASEKRDNFNIPVYAPSLQDFKEVVEADGSFAINKLEVFRGGSPLVVSLPDDATEIGRAMANSCRAVSGVLVDAHIGDRLSEELFSRVASRAASQANELLEQLQFFHIVASLSLLLS
ncbi:IAA carboxylmethyltransferase 1 [Actinidia rufa]|uniref:IAA carboxylmethyltransferase 1 n=1 Tax=Actinidia rufa TaxID=165716 RepID=A0A7J0G2G2_9ERIC|nr:IAA carboxylmethyltransferase 1 [Actinidia rufa]